MIIQPKVRGYICTTAHPIGCAKHVQKQIDYVRSQPPIKNGPKNVLIIGASTGYGLASRIVAAFGCRAATMGVFFEKPPEGKRTATAGWYKSIAFDRACKEAGIYSKSINGDAFSDETKAKVIELIRKDMGTVDLVIYSLAAPRRVHPQTGKICKSTLKPCGKSYTNKSIDFDTGEVEKVTLPPATPEEIEQTIAVMGGEDWAMWLEALEKAKVLAPGVITVAYSYVGPEVTRPVYRNGTIGAAKDHLEATAKDLDEKLKNAHGGRALISVNKALVTQSSSAIPFIPLYYILLNRVMKEKGVDEDCIHQMYRLFATKLYRDDGQIPIDENGMIRLDEFELREDVQKEVAEKWEEVNTGNVQEISDIEGYKKEFLRLFGFGYDDVDYSADVEHNLPLEE